MQRATVTYQFHGWRCGTWDARYEGCCKKMSSHVIYDQLPGIINSHLDDMSSAILLLQSPLHVNLYLFIEALPEYIHDCPKSRDTWIRCFTRFQSWWRHTQLMLSLPVARCNHWSVVGWNHTCPVPLEVMSATNLISGERLRRSPWDLHRSEIESTDFIETCVYLKSRKVSLNF
jgi:hypothetical protein